MNKKAELFKKYIKEKNITCFEVQEVPEDELETVIFRSSINVEGQALPTLVITDNSIYTMVRVRIANAAMKEENELALRQAIGALNAQFKIFKFYFIPDGALIMDAYILDKPDELDGNMVYTVLDVIVKHLTVEYKNIMKKIWA